MGVLISGLGTVWVVSHSQQPDERAFRLQLNPPEDSRFAFRPTSGGMALSSDGTTIAYIGSSNGKDRLWVQPLDNTTARPVPGTEGAAHPFWPPDNKPIAFFASGKLERVDLAGGAPVLICDALNDRGGAWSSDGRIIFSEAATGLFQVPASGGTPSRLTTFDASRGEYGHRWPQVLRGGHFLFLVQSDKPENEGIFAASFAKPVDRIRLLATDTNALFAAGTTEKISPSGCVERLCSRRNLISVG
jgi:hypothetical protein